MSRSPEFWKMAFDGLRQRRILDKLFGASLFNQEISAIGGLGRGGGDLRSIDASRLRDFA